MHLTDPACHKFAGALRGRAIKNLWTSRALFLLALFYCGSPWSNAGRGGEFLRISDPEKPIVDIGLIVRERADSEHRFTVGKTNVIVTYPSECGDSIEDVSVLIASAMKRLTQRLDPIELGTAVEIVLVEDTGLPANIRFRHTGNRFTLLVLAGESCAEDGWFEAPQVWRHLIEHFLHELVHSSIGDRAPKRSPQWLVDGQANFLSYSISAELQNERELPSRSASAALAMFVSASPQEIERIFSNRFETSSTHSNAVDTWRAYDLFTGAFEAALELGEDLSATVIAILVSNESRRVTANKLRAIDAKDLHARAAKLRPTLIETATSSLGRPNERAFGLQTLGFLGACLEDVSVLEAGPGICTAQSAMLAPYFGSCLNEKDLRMLLSSIANCGNKMYPGWVVAIERYVERFPATAAGVVDPFLANTRSYYHEHLQRLLKESASRSG